MWIGVPPSGDLMISTQAAFFYANVITHIILRQLITFIFRIQLALCVTIFVIAISAGGISNFFSLSSNMDESF